jgi:hypothetical protein
LFKEVKMRPLQPAPNDIKAAADRAASPKTPPARDQAIKAAAARAADRAEISAAAVERLGDGPKAPANADTKENGED